MQLILKKPLVTFDLETTGLDLSRDRIVSIAMTKLMPDNTEISLEFLINPAMPMSEEVIAIHGITNEQLFHLPFFSYFAPSIYEFIKDCDLLGYNLLNFDVPMLAEHFYREGIHNWPSLDTQIIDAGNIFKKMEPRNLAAALQFYCGKEHAEAHTAGGDVAATIKVFKGQLNRYPDLGNDVEALAAFSKMDDRVDLAGKIAKDKDGDYIYNFSANKGTKVRDNIGFAYWILQRDFPFNTKLVLQQILKEVHPPLEFNEAGYYERGF